MEINNMEDAERVQGNDKEEKYRTRMLWTCACSYLIPLIFLFVYISIKIYLNIRYHYSF
jgi:hypothetical protein